MNGSQVFFCATANDVLPVLEAMDNDFPANYYESGLLDTSDIACYSGAINLPSIGYSTTGDWMTSATFIVLPKFEKLLFREVPQRAGGIKYAVDLKLNEGIAITLGGVYIKKQKAIVAGRVGTIWNSEFPTAYTTFFRKQLRRFSKFGRFYVGKEANFLLQDGWRLALDVGRDPAYDIK